YSGEVFSGLIGAGVLAAIMSSMDSQFLCLSSLFANDLFARYSGKSLSDSKQILLGRALVLIIVFTCYLIGLTEPKSVFKLGVWCFSGFSGLVPLLFASLYWRGTTKAGAIASVAAVAGVWLYHFFSGSPVAPPEQTVGAGAAALFLVSWVTPKLSPEHLEKFFPAPKEA
ncbi:MAG: sodium:solute symporter family protein, partial [Planctomycetota bacterium]